MSQTIGSTLLDLLACPDCATPLREDAGGLRCSACGRAYEVRDCIPRLYPAGSDTEHLAEEERLAARMLEATRSEPDSFNSRQWHLAKEEIWAIFRERLAPPPHTHSHTSILNVGCGYDAHFREFQGAGHTFVNFDMVPAMLSSLREKHGAEACIAGDMNRMPFRKESFDVVVSIDTLHHEVRRLDEILLSLAMPLRRGGTLFLADPNAWGLFQFPKSLFLPRPLYVRLRRTYHRLRRISREPADYEFPTNLFRVRKRLEEIGFRDINVYPQHSYPGIGPARFRLYAAVSRCRWVRMYANYHYVLSARKV